MYIKPLKGLRGIRFTKLAREKLAPPRIVRAAANSAMDVDEVLHDHAS
jgi:hypothetical protein